MPACERLATCIFFQDRMADMPLKASALKERYCRGDFRACARHRVLMALGPGHVPDDLFPHMKALAELLLAGARQNG